MYPKLSTRSNIELGGEYLELHFWVNVLLCKEKTPNERSLRPSASQRRSVARDDTSVCLNSGAQKRFKQYMAMNLDMEPLVRGLVDMNHHVHQRVP